MFKARFERVGPNQLGRDFAVGDIHGCFTALQTALNHIGFNPAADRLFAVGDLVDRGPESSQVTDWLEKPWFHSIFGNHELMICHTVLQDPDCPGAEDQWLQSLDVNEKRRIARRLLQLPLIMEIDTPDGIVGLIHADCPFDNWKDLQTRDWPQFNEADALVHTCLWSIERHRRKYTGIIKNVRAVVHGHLTLRQAERLGNVYYIDTKGGIELANFTFLNLQTLESISAPGERHAQRRVLTPGH